MIRPDHERFPKHRHLLIGGQRWPVDAQAVLWPDSGLEVRVGRGARRRGDGAIDKFVWHWTGGENDIRTLFRVLQGRELAVEFAIDVSGIVWQFCDPAEVDTFDAGAVNRTSAGCEVVNYGFVAPGREPPPRGVGRGTYRRTFRGSMREFARFHPAQLRAALALAETVSRALPVPRVIPREPDGSIMARTMRSAELVAYRGHLGHYHVSERKSDPGLDLLESLAAAGF